MEGKHNVPCPDCGKDRWFKNPKQVKGTSCYSCGARKRPRFDWKNASEKKCSRCKQVKPLDEFYRHTSGKPFPYCLICKGEAFRSYQKEVGRFARYGLTKADYDRMCAEQDGRCAICKGQFDTLCIDHCHSTGVVRKLLCMKCNSALGMLKDNLVAAKNLVAYLEQHGTR